jgi:hypothetical protein
MRQLFPRHNRFGEPLYRRLDRAAGRLNPLLMVIAIGLAILNASCLLTLFDTGKLPVRCVDPGQARSAPVTDASPN